MNECTQLELDFKNKSQQFFENMTMIEEQKSQVECRICLQKGKNMIQPCRCQGSIGWVHQLCLVQYVVIKTQKEVSCHPRNYYKYRCQVCRMEMNFLYDFKYILICNPWTEGKRFVNWLVFLVLLIILGLVQTLMLIMITVYYNGFTESPLFAQGKIWIIIAVTPLIALGLFFIIFYFIAENLFQQIQIYGALSKETKVIYQQVSSGCITPLGYKIVISNKLTNDIVNS